MSFDPLTKLVLLIILININETYVETLNSNIFY